MAVFSIKVSTVELDITPVVTPDADVDTFVEALVDDLDANGIGTKGTDLFFDQWPDVETSPCVVLKDIGGQPTRLPVADINVQFWCRAASFEAARRHAADVYNHFDTATGKLVTGYRILRAVANSLPTSVGEDDHERVLVTWTMSFLAYATTQGSSLVGVGGKRDPNAE
jgi:hypothetical protein